MLTFSNLRLITEDNQNKKTISKIESHNLPYPSLNEVNYLAFNESDLEYHNELYGFIEGEGWLQEYKIGKVLKQYIRQKRNGSTLQEQKILTEYIRHQIHHPENTHNTKYTKEELQQSLQSMRDFIIEKNS